MLQRIVVVGILAVVLCDDAVLGATASKVKWSSVLESIDDTISDHRQQTKADAFTPALQTREKLSKLLDAALSPETKGPGLAARLGKLLPYLDELSPEVHFELFVLLSARLSQTIAALPDDQVDAFIKLAKPLWPRRLKRVGETTIQRIVVADSIGPLLDKTTKRAEVIALVVTALEREVDWISKVQKKPDSLKDAIEKLGVDPEQPSIYSVLSALRAVHRVALASQDPNAILDPIFTDLIHLLARLQVQVKGKQKGDVLNPLDQASPTQLRLWFRVTELLREWTGQQQFVWFEDWLKFWGIYFDEKRPKKDRKFDFLAVASGASGTGAGGGTVVVVKREQLFGIEQRSSKFLIIIDVSGSMVQNDHGINRMAKLQKEVIRFVSMLRPGVHYNILPFSNDCDIRASLTKSHKLFPKTLPRGRISPRTKAWVMGLRPGGVTRVDLAFRTAFNKPLKQDPTKPLQKPFRPEFNEIYFITDGSPTDRSGDVLPPPRQLEILREIEGLNARHRAHIHTLGFRGMSMGFIRNMATRNNGKSREIR